MITLFVYGTLCFPEITEKLTGKSFVSEHAVLKGYERKKVKNADYPAVVTNSNSEVKGVLLKDVDERSFRIISFYESNEYRCDDAEVLVNGKPVKAKVFVWNSVIDELEDLDWNKNEFTQESLKIYIEKIIPETLKEYNL